LRCRPATCPEPCSKRKFRFTNWIKEDSAMVFEDVRVTVLKATMAILSLSLALASICLAGWWA
jgi:hypothetical protein